MNKTIKENIIKYFKSIKTKSADIKLAAKKLGMTTKNLMSYLWCMEKRENSLFYFAARGKVEVILF